MPNKFMKAGNHICEASDPPAIGGELGGSAWRGDSPGEGAEVDGNIEIYEFVSIIPS
jgi:hypothetical protein